MTDWLVGISAALLAPWLLLVALLWRIRPDEASLRESMRLLPDTVRLVGRLARDSTLPRGVRLRLWLLLAYLVSPIDLVPDFVPVLGWADDAVLVVWTLRAVLARTPYTHLAQHWPGSAAGLRALTGLVART